MASLRRIISNNRQITEMEHKKNSILIKSKNNFLLFTMILDFLVLSGLIALNIFLRLVFLDLFKIFCSFEYIKF